jgi:hypothetical protein
MQADLRVDHDLLGGREPVHVELDVERDVAFHQG